MQRIARKYSVNPWSSGTFAQLNQGAGVKIPRVCRTRTIALAALLRWRKLHMRHYRYHTWKAREKVLLHTPSVSDTWVPYLAVKGRVFGEVDWLRMISCRI